jgi:hypothetical protein
MKARDNNGLFCGYCYMVDRWAMRYIGNNINSKDLGWYIFLNMKTKNYEDYDKLSKAYRIPKYLRNEAQQSLIDNDITKRFSIHKKNFDKHEIVLIEGQPEPVYEKQQYTRLAKYDSWLKPTGGVRYEL